MFVHMLIISIIMYTLSIMETCLFLNIWLQNVIKLNYGRNLKYTGKCVTQFHN